MTKRYIVKKTNEPFDWRMWQVFDTWNNTIRCRCVLKDVAVAIAGRLNKGES